MWSRSELAQFISEHEQQSLEVVTPPKKVFSEAEFLSELEGLSAPEVFTRVRELSAMMGLNMAQVEIFIARLEHSALRVAHFEKVARCASQLTPSKRTQRPPSRIR
jgi:hypothetical protein